MTNLARIFAAVAIFLAPMAASAGPGEEADAAIGRWSAAYTANDQDAVVKSHWPDAMLLGTVSPVMSDGTEAIRTYFSRLRGTGNKNMATRI